MEQRHLRDDDAPLFHAETVEVVVCVGDKTSMVEGRAFGEAGGPGRVLDHDLIARGDCRQRDRWIARCEKVVPLTESDDLLEVGAVCANLLGDGEHRVATVVVDHEKTLRVRLADDVLQLVGLICRVDGHDGHTRQCTAQLDEHPLGDVVRPDRHVIARRESSKQCLRSSFRIGEQLGIRPFAATAGIIDALDQRNPIAGACGGGPKQIADGGVENAGLLNAEGM